MLSRSTACGAVRLSAGKRGWAAAHWLRWDGRKAADGATRHAHVATAPAQPVALRGRAHLPDSANGLLPDTLRGPTADLPRPAELPGAPADAVACGEAVRAQCDELLYDAGALFFRTPMRSSAEFDKFIRATKWQTDGSSEFARCMSARSMTSTCISERVRTASDDHHLYTVEPHHEYHTAGFPEKIVLFCEKAPAAGGGEWIVGDGRQILRELDPEVVAEFERRGSRYIVFYPSKESSDGNLYNNWETNVMPTREETETYLRQLGYEWSWGADNSLTYWQDFPAVREHPVTGARVFYNQIHAHHKSFYECHPVFNAVGRKGDPDHLSGRWPVHSTFADGGEIPQKTLDHMRDVIWRNCVAVRPTPGDVIVYDNWTTLHGRIGWDGPQDSRKVFVAATFDAVQ